MAENPKHPDAHRIAGTVESLEQVIKSIKDVATLEYLNEDEGVELFELAALAVPLYEKFLERMSQELLGEDPEDTEEKDLRLHRREHLLENMMRSGAPKVQALGLKLSRNTLKH